MQSLHCVTWRSDNRLSHHDAKEKQRCRGSPGLQCIQASKNNTQSQCLQPELLLGQQSIYYGWRVGCVTARLMSGHGSHAGADKSSKHPVSAEISEHISSLHQSLIYLILFPRRWQRLRAYLETCMYFGTKKGFFNRQTYQYMMLMSNALDSGLMKTWK